MIEYMTELVEKKSMKSFVCDKCGKKYTAESEDVFELQETYSINFTGGYSSVFGDGNTVTCDLCQHCLYELIWLFCKYNSEC